MTDENEKLSSLEPYHAPESPPQYIGPPLSEEEAQAIYRSAWHSWLLCTDRETRRSHEQTMDWMQPFIARGPFDPRWQTFADSLPGFREVWGKPSIILQRMGIESPAMLDALDALAAPPEES